jgi:hypothetical protein
MPRALPPIPANTPIADVKDGTITTFMRLRWQQLVDGWAQTGATAAFSTVAAGQTAALPTTAVFTTPTPGVYRVTWFVRKTRADGAASSLTVTIGGVDLDGQPLTYSGAALTLDTTTAWQSDTKLLRCRAPSDLTVAVAYSSTTAGQMRYDLEVRVEQVA